MQQKPITQFYCSIHLDNGLEYKHLNFTQQLQVSLGNIFSKQLTEFLSFKEAFEYDGRYKVENDEALFINNFTLPKIINDLTKGQVTLPDLKNNEINKGKITSIFGIQIVNSKDYIIGFQSITGNNIIRTDKFNIFMSNDTFEKIDSPGISINDNLAAVYKNGVLYFKSFAVARRFIDLSPYLVEASDEEIRKFFLNNPVVLEDQEIFEKNKDEWVRKKIFLIDKGDLFNEIPIDEIKKKAKQIKLKLVTKYIGKTEKIVIPSDKKAMKLVLSFLDDDILDSILTGRRYISNSKRELT